MHVDISSKLQTMDSIYEIVIEGWNNIMFVIRRRSQRPNLCTVVVGFNKLQNAVNYLWVSIDKKMIGHGKEPDLSSVSYIYKDVNFIRET